MEKEEKPTHTTRLSQDARDLGRWILEEDALRTAEQRAAENGEEFMPDDDRPVRAAQALRELDEYLNQQRRGQRKEEDAAAKSGIPLLRGADQVPAIDLGAQPEAPLPVQDVRDAADTEALLNTLISECHFLMREVAFRTMCDSKDPLDRLRFLDVTTSLMKAGATVGDAIAKLRHGDVKRIHQSFNHQQTPVRPEGAAEGGGRGARP